MGRRRSIGSGGSKSDRILRRHIESAGKNYSTVEQLVDHLRSAYPYYARHKLRPFTKKVERVTKISRRSEDDDDDGGTPMVIKRRKIDNEEEKLQLIEAENFMRRRNADVSTNGSGGECSSSLLACSASCLDGGGSSYEESLTLEFEEVNKEAVELEVVDNKGKKEVNLMNVESKSKLGDKLNRNYRTNLNKNDSRNLSSGKDGNVINGPMFKDLGGISGVIELLKRKIIRPLHHPELACHLGVKPMTGILFHGPPGCGKTQLARAIANETGVPFYEICATDLVSGVSGASEENIRELFSKAYRTAPSIVFIDEIDAIASKRDNLQRETDKRIVTQLLTSMDGLRVSRSSDCRPGYVLVIGATNRPDALDPALRRTGRFNREIALGVPDEAARIEILTVLVQNLIVEGALDILKIARSTAGFAVADLTELGDEAGNLAINRILDEREVELSKEEKEHSEERSRQPLSDEEMEDLSITMADFEESAKMIQPSTRREGFSAIPNVKWDDVGGLHLLRKEFNLYIVGRIKFPEDYEEFGLDLATGFLLYGPPGCGKTLIAKAVANEAGASFIHIKGPELLSKYVGESELAVRRIFSRARTCSPCIVFFDEVDALTTKRGGQEGGGVVERVLNQLLIELDGSEQRKGVYVIGATNRPDVIDDALLRPGRFAKLMYVPLPSPDERGMILKALARKKPIDANVDLIALAKDTRCDNLSGADLSHLMDRAAMAALIEKQSSPDRSSSVPRTIKDAHFMSALQEISPSVSDEQIQCYKLLSEKFRR